MTQETAMHSTESQQPQRKPRLALMGEFSAGKSTLTNLLVGRPILPTRVTATRLPPVWISYGEEAAFVVSNDGTQTAINPENLNEVEMETTAMIRLFFPSDALTLCDLIDMPGISDPNMPAEVWQSLMPEVDGVIWCTHSTQAWRQSEAAVWESIADGVSGPNILLITHFDKLRSERDRARVNARVCKETDGLFNRVFPISLSQALEADDDMEAWSNSGADALVEFLVETLLNRPQHGAAVASITAEPADNTPGQIAQAEVVAITETRKASEQAEQAQPTAAPAADPAGGDYVVPRRVKAQRQGARPSLRQPRPDGVDD